jgi:hypothetical protein
LLSRIGNGVFGRRNRFPIRLFKEFGSQYTSTFRQVTGFNKVMDMTRPAPIKAPHEPTRLRTRLRTLILFILTLVALDLLIHLNRKTWVAHSPDGYLERVTKCASEPRDLVFIGGSTIAEGINPTGVGPIPWQGRTLANHYAVGLSGGTTSDIYFAAIHACPTPPSLLVYGITASDINDSRHEPHGPHSLMNWADVQDWRATRPEAAEWVTRHYLRGQADQVWAAYRYRHGIRMWAAKLGDRFIPGSSPEAFTEMERQRQTADWLKHGNGYAPTQWFAQRRYDQMKAGGWQQPPFEYLAQYRTGSHWKYLHRLIDWCEDHGTKLILIDMPTTADLELRHPAEFAEFRLRLADLERERGLKIFRASQEATGLTDEHFADLIHLNLSGCEKLSAWVKTKLTPKQEADTPRGLPSRGAFP